MTVSAWYRWDNQDLVLSLLVQPRASRDKFVSLQGDVYKISITAPPVDGRANEHLVGFIAKAFGVKNSAVRVVYGMHSRRKVVRIQNPRLLPISVQPPQKPLNF